MGRTYHHPGAQTGGPEDLERELAKTAEYERRHARLGRSMKWGVDESPHVPREAGVDGGWRVTLPAVAFLALTGLGFTLATRRPAEATRRRGSMRGDDAVS
jgi:hypothetical protein